ncbi:uncharacterized protein LOC119435362 [Dermacentor silvarum]|uniref:uncharacterized protein LOC119435362 n=1 Tax=Dermacentor silvarum TaxID=543639 RepID=UPI0021017EE6|nr:uncharacterized protein LOC119435362 [Dermacentor silvarum]
MSVRCLVTVPDLQAKRSYTIEVGKLDALKAAISTCPVIGDKLNLSTCTFKILEPHFGEQVDLAPGDDIHDLARVTVLSSQPLETEASSALRKEEDNESETSVAASVGAGSSTGLDCFDLPSRSDDDGNSFVFPSFGSLHDAIVSNSPVTSAMFRQIVDLLFQAMLKITV